MTATNEVVFLLDIDNTLLDNDRIVADLGALQRYRVGGMNDPRLLMLFSFLVDYPFSERLYPGALDVIAYLRRWGPTVILPDGDVVLQPRKAQRSGLWDAVEGRGGCSFTCTKSKCLMTSNSVTRLVITSWWTTSCAFWRQ